MVSISSFSCGVVKTQVFLAFIFRALGCGPEIAALLLAENILGSTEARANRFTQTNSVFRKQAGLDVRSAHDRIDKDWFLTFQVILLGCCTQVAELAFKWYLSEALDALLGQG